MSSTTFGLELSFSNVADAVKRKDDVLVVIVHWFLTKFGFLCIGLGDDKTLTGNESGSELLPSGWNEAETISLRYVYDGKLFILRGVRADDTLIFNLLHTPDLNVSNLAVNVSEVVNDIRGSVENMVPRHNRLVERICKELVEPVTKKISSEATTQTPAQTPSEQHPHPSYVEDDRRDPLRVGVGGSGMPNRFDPYNYGRSDLDPLGIGIGGRGGTGGMLFDPLRGGRGRDPPGGLPRGRVPGSRFDPIVPPGIGGPRGGFNPDPDHLPPPGYDDMFM